MFYTITSKIPFIENDNSKTKIIKLFAIGSIMYVMVHYYINSNPMPDIVEKYRKYFYALMVVDLAIAWFMISRNNQQSEEDDDEPTPEEIQMMQQQQMMAARMGGMDPRMGMDPRIMSPEMQEAYQQEMLRRATLQQQQENKQENKQETKQVILFKKKDDGEKSSDKEQKIKEIPTPPQKNIEKESKKSKSEDQTEVQLPQYNR